MENLVVMIGWSLSAIFFFIVAIVIYIKCGHVEEEEHGEKTSKT